MTDRKIQLSKDAEREKRKPAVSTTGQLPDAGALDEGDIKRVDLELRSNGEIDWQDEVPADRAGMPNRKRR